MSAADTWLARQHVRDQAAAEERERLSEVMGELRAEIRRLEGERDRYRAAVGRVRRLTADYMALAESAPDGRVDCEELVRDLHKALSAAEPPGVDSGTSEAVSGGSVDVGPAGGAAAETPQAERPNGEYRITCGFHGELRQRYAHHEADAALCKAEAHRSRCVGAVGVEFAPTGATS